MTVVCRVLFVLCLIVACCWRLVCYVVVVVVCQCFLVDV